MAHTVCPSQTFCTYVHKPSYQNFIFQTSPGPAADSERKPADDVRRLQQTIESLKQENSHLKVTDSFCPSKDFNKRNLPQNVSFLITRGKSRMVLLVNFLTFLKLLFFVLLLLYVT